MNKASLVSVATALLDHADAVVVQAGAYEGLGPGEIPSLPRLLPKILHSTFRHCLEDQQQEESDGLVAELEPALGQLFCRARGLLDNFLGLVERMKIRTALEDERDLVLELCADLVGYHKLLIAIDLKSALKVTVLIFLLYVLEFFTLESV